MKVEKKFVGGDIRSLWEWIYHFRRRMCLPINACNHVSNLTYCGCFVFKGSKILLRRSVNKGTVTICIQQTIDQNIMLPVYTGDSASFFTTCGIFLEFGMVAALIGLNVDTLEWECLRCLLITSTLSVIVMLLVAIAISSAVNDDSKTMTTHQWMKQAGNRPDNLSMRKVVKSCELCQSLLVLLEL